MEVASKKGSCRTNDSVTAQGVDKANNLYQHRFLPKLYKSYHSAFPGAGDCSKKLPAVKGCPSTSAQRTAP